MRGKVAARTVSDYLARADPPFTTKVIQDQEPEELTEEWRAGARWWLEGVKKLRLDAMKTRHSSLCERSSETRASTEGKHPSFERDLATPKQYTLHVHAKRSGVLHWDLSQDMQTRKRLTRVAIDAVGAMKSGETVIWDRLGRSGRAVNPSSQHYSPVARDLFEEVWRVDQVLASEGQVF